MLLTLKLLALSERLALRFNLVLVSAGAGALAGIAYTLLTGAQVLTVRSCIAALVVLLGIALGRFDQSAAGGGPCPHRSPFPPRRARRPQLPVQPRCGHGDWATQMVESERNEGDLDGQSRQDHAEEHPERPRDRTFIPPHEQSATQTGRVQRDDAAKVCTALAQARSQGAGADRRRCPLSG